MAEAPTAGKVTARVRGITSAVFAVLAAVLALLAITVVYVDRTVFDADQFADRAVVALDDPATQNALSTALADALVAENPDLIPQRPVIEFATEAIIDNASFESIFRNAARESHRVFFDDDGGLVLELGDSGQLVKAVLGASNPEIAEALPPELDTALITLSEREFATETLEAAEGVSELALILPVAALIALIAALLVAVNRRRAVVIVGLSMALVLGIGLVAIGVARGILINDFPQGEVAGVVWDAFLDDLNTALLLAIAGSVVIAAAAASLLFPYDLPAGARRAWARLATPPERTGWRVAWALAIALVGIIVALDPLQALKLVGVVAGVFLMFFGVAQLMDILDDRTSEQVRDEARGAFGGILRGAVAAVVAIALVLIGAFSIGGGSADAQDIEACNGHAELCDRPVSAVAMAGTHNSMSAAREGFQLSMHDGGIIEQLDGGIRALLIDTWYGIPRGDVVFTDLPASGVSEEEQAAVYGQEAVDAATRLRERATGDGGARNTYMCHGWCELGSVPLTGELARIRAWLDDNPDQVITLIVQDAISPADTEEAFRESGLLDLVYRHTPGEPFPTLRELISSDQRVIVMAEKNTDPDLDWYLQAYDYTEETPFRALTPADFTCRPDRGGTGQPFFLLNHWIEKAQPRASDAEIVNARGFLLDRARTCEAARGALPNILAVNYWGVGDVIAVVEELNGVGDSP